MKDKNLYQVLSEFDEDVLKTKVSDNFYFQGNGEKGKKRLSIVDEDNSKSIELKVENLYRVDYEITEYHNSEDKVKHSIKKQTFYYKNREDAWKFFEEQLPSMVNYCGAFVGWNDKFVEFSISDYDHIHYLLYKWDDFDNDVELGWRVGNDDKVYHSYEELWEAHPSFEGKHMFNDRPWFLSKDGTEHADLVINTRFADGPLFRSDNKKKLPNVKIVDTKDGVEVVKEITIDDEDLPF